MEVKYEKTGLNSSILNIYIDDELWKSVKSSYFERKMSALIKKGDFKKAFENLERKKIISITLYLLSKKNYLKNEWFFKMKGKLFTYSTLNEVFNESLSPYFDEEKEIIRRIEGYLSLGKGKHWIEMKMSKDILISKAEFQTLLYQFCSEEDQIEKLKLIEKSRNLLNVKGKDKMIAFYLRRGFSYSTIKKALHIY